MSKSFKWNLGERFALVLELESPSSLSGRGQLSHDEGLRRNLLVLPWLRICNKRTEVYLDLET